MLFRLEIENFYSVAERQTIDLLAGKSVLSEPGRLAPIGPGAQERAPKVVAIFGPNASGKSNTLKALSFLAWFVKESFNLLPDKFLLFKRFEDEAYQDKPTRLCVSFTGPTDPRKLGQPSNECSKYTYEVVFGGTRDTPQYVVSESLKYWSFETRKPIVLFHRTERGTVKGHRVFGLAGYQTALQNVLRPNVSVISTLTQLRHPIATALWHASSQVTSNLFVEISDFTDDQIAKVYGSHPPLLAALNRELEKIDLGIMEMKLVAGADGPVALVQHNGLDRSLPLFFESHGTRQFIRVFPLIFYALEHGSIAVIDELDLSIHPLVLPEILRWFYDPRRNPDNAQLWMTGQSASLLEDLTKEEIFFCEKDRKGRTEVFGLRDIQDVRRTDNFYRKYLGGMYGAVPRLG